MGFYANKTLFPHSDIIYGETSSHKCIILVWNVMYIMCGTQGSLPIEN